MTLLHAVRKYAGENMQKTVADFDKIKFADSYSKKRPATIARLQALGSASSFPAGGHLHAPASVDVHQLRGPWQSRLVR